MICCIAYSSKHGARDRLPIALKQRGLTPGRSKKDMSAAFSSWFVNHLPHT